MMGGIEPAWYGLDMQVWYLPKIKSGCITSKYLFELATGKCFRLKKEQIKYGTLLKKISKRELFYQIQQIANQQSVSLGFEKSLPNKEWLEQVFHTLTGGQNEIFQKPTDYLETIQITAEELESLKKLDTSLGRPKQLRFFKRTLEQVQLHKMRKRDKKLQKLQTILKSKERDLKEKKKELQEQEIKAIEVGLKKESFKQQYKP